MKIKINGKFYDYFNDVTIKKTLDAVASSFAFSVEFDLSNPIIRDLIRPLSFHKVEIFDEDKLLLTGTIIKHTFSSESTSNMVILSGYSLGGVLEDCNIPYDSYPLESINRTLKEITTRLLKYFNLNLIVDKTVARECNQNIAKSVASPEDTVKGYLAKVAAQKNVVISHNEKGEIVFFRPVTTSLSKMLYTPENTDAMGNDVNGQSMHSTITTLRQPGKKKDGGDAILSESQEKQTLTPVDTINNQLIKSFRPAVSVLSSGSETDTSFGAKNILASELKNIAISFNLDRWDPIETGDIVDVINERIYLFNRTRFIVESITQSESSSSKSMIVTVVLPETFTGEQPKNIFA